MAIAARSRRRGWPGSWDRRCSIPGRRPVESCVGRRQPQRRAGRRRCGRRVCPPGRAGELRRRSAIRGVPGVGRSPGSARHWPDWRGWKSVRNTSGVPRMCVPPPPTACGRSRRPAVGSIPGTRRRLPARSPRPPESRVSILVLARWNAGPPAEREPKGPAGTLTKELLYALSLSHSRDLWHPSDDIGKREAMRGR